MGKGMQNIIAGGRCLPSCFRQREGGFFMTEVPYELPAFRQNTN